MEGIRIRIRIRRRRRRIIIIQCQRKSLSCLPHTCLVVFVTARVGVSILAAEDKSRSNAYSSNKTPWTFAAIAYFRDHLESFALLFFFFLSCSSAHNKPETPCTDRHVLVGLQVARTLQCSNEPTRATPL